VFIEKIRQIFPDSLIVDAALKYPITEDGWEVDMPEIEDCRFHLKDFRLILILQDMLTIDDTSLFPRELTQIHSHYFNKVDLNQLIVITWPCGLAADWNQTNSFTVVEFSSHQYNLWEAYKQSEDVLREEFKHKDYEDNFLCMNRIDKPHRRAIYGAIKDCPGNSSYQHMGIELKYPGFSYTEYNKHYDNLLNLLTLKKNFNTSLFSIICESQYYERYGIITEKTFNAMVAGHPFIMIGHQSALQDIKSYGFKTFDNMFNEDYDAEDNSKRGVDALHANWLMIGKTMAAKSMYELQHYCHDDIEYNRDYFFNEFGNYLINSLQQQLLKSWS